MRYTTRRLIPTTFFMIGFLSAGLTAQTESTPCQDCAIVEVVADGMLRVTINGKSYLAIDDQTRDNIARRDDRLKECEALLENKDQQIAEYKTQVAGLEQIRKGLETDIESYKKDIVSYQEGAEDLNGVIDAKNNRITALEGVRDTYKELVELLEKKTNKGWLSFSGGVGATTGGDFRDSEPAVLFGVGIKKFRVWGFAQDNNSGVMVGVEFPIF